jgi:DNA-binding IclR family transcriptional regulator
LSPKKNLKGATVGVLTKVLKIFDLLQSHPAGVELKEISLATGINKSTSYRFLSHLERESYVKRTAAGSYVIGVKLIALGNGTDHRTMLRETSLPTLRELQKVTQETVNLGVLDEDQVLYIEVLESPHAFRLVSQVGIHRPLHSTALGKALAAFMPADRREQLLNGMTFQPFTRRTISSSLRFEKELAEVYRRGYSLDNEESVPGARCVAAAIVNSRNEAVAAISVSGPVARITRDKVPAVAAAVKEAVRTISERMGFAGQSPASVLAGKPDGR